jgi:Leucine-rich repeat (LRR) protein
MQPTDSEKLQALILSGDAANIRLAQQIAKGTENKEILRLLKRLGKCVQFLGKYIGTLNKSHLKAKIWNAIAILIQDVRRYGLVAEVENGTLAASETPFVLPKALAVLELLKPEEVSFLRFPFFQFPKILKKFKHIKSLTLKDCNLYEFPKEILELPTPLQTLDLSKNFIPELPKNLEKLSQVSTLQLQMHVPLQLPENLAQLLPNVMDFGFGQDTAANFPEVIWEFKNIRTLELGGAGIKNIPEAIGNLSELTFLRLNNTSISDLPAGFAHLQKLRRLEINHALQLEKIPEPIYQLTNLACLSFSNTGLSTFDQSLAKLQKLMKFLVTSPAFAPATEDFWQQQLENWLPKTRIELFFGF